MIGILNFFQDLLDKTRALDFLAPLALFFLGAGKYFSVDYYLAHRWRH